jgi:hypothetical protein
MNILEYLQKKYSVVVPTTIKKAEANIFGISYPLTQNWLSLHGGREIDSGMKARLVQSLIARNDRFSADGLSALGETMPPKPSPPPMAKADRKHKARVAKKAAKVRALEAKIAAGKKAACTYPNKVSVQGVDVSSNDFLQTYEWRRVRMEAIKKYGPVCMCCGATKDTGAVINVDHIKPRKLFPGLALSLDNLQILCHECNHGKGNWDMTDWRPQEDDFESIRILREIARG